MSSRRVRDRPESGGQDEPNALACLPFTVCERLLVFAGMESLQEHEDVLFRLDGPSCRLSNVFQGKYLERRRLNLGWSEFPKGLIQLLLQRPLSSLDALLVNHTFYIRSTTTSPFSNIFERSCCASGDPSARATER